MNGIRRDLLSQGETADFARAETYLSAKWMTWFLKLKYGISLCMQSLEMNMVPDLHS